MAFYGCEFNFNGTSCSEMGLMVYDFGSNTQSDVSFASAGKIISDTTSRRYDNFFYGLEQNTSMEYTLVFGANLESIDNNEHIDRFEVEYIASWLTGHDSMKWLEIVQPDMETFRYKCIISELQLITYGRMPWAFSCKVTCDSPFAYTHRERQVVEVSGGKAITYFNRSTYNGYYKPKNAIRARVLYSKGSRISIVNKSDNNRTFSFTELPTGTYDIEVDNQNQVILAYRIETNANDEEVKVPVNLYPYFNYKFFRALRGDNELDISSYSNYRETVVSPNGATLDQGFYAPIDCTIEIISEFPVNIGA